MVRLLNLSGHQMTESFSPLRVEQHGRWTLKFFSIAQLGGHVVLAADVLLGDVVKGRRSVTRVGVGEQQAVNDLRARAIEWIADYEARAHSGNTGSADL